MVSVLAHAAALSDLHGHGSGHHIAGGQVLGGGGVSLHEALSLRIAQDATLATAALGDQAASAVDASGVELHELRVLQRDAGAQGHAVSVTSAGVSGGAAEVGAAVATSGQHGVVCSVQYNQTKHTT